MSEYAELENQWPGLAEAGFEVIRLTPGTYPGLGDQYGAIYRPGSRRTGVPKHVLDGTTPCVIQLRTGRRTLQRIRAGYSSGRYMLLHPVTLEATDDQEVEWAAPVDFFARLRPADVPPPARPRRKKQPGKHAPAPRML